jgi:hypothetical protein
MVALCVYIYIIYQLHRENIYIFICLIFLRCYKTESFHNPLFKNKYKNRIFSFIYVFYINIHDHDFMSLIIQYFWII